MILINIHILIQRKLKMVDIDSKSFNNMINTGAVSSQSILINRSEEINEGSSKNSDSIIESTTVISEQKIGYCIYGHGHIKMLFICGGVGKLYSNCYLKCMSNVRKTLN